MIKFKNVSKILKNETVIDDISFTFEKGKTYLLKGHNGSGKTMLLRLICGLITPTTGLISKSEHSYGVIIENPTFVETETARQNLNFLASIQKKINMEQIEEALKKVNLHQFADKKVKKFSLGMKQRLAFCQAIMEDPDVLVLDEPFNALDEENFHLMIETIQQLRKDKLIIIAAHGFDNEKHQIFDEILTLENGALKVHKNLTALQYIELKKSS